MESETITDAPRMRHTYTHRVRTISPQILVRGLKMGTMLQLEAIGRKPRIRSVHQIHIQRVERGRWLLLVVLCLDVELRRRRERRPRWRNGGRHRGDRFLRAHLQPVETCPAVFGDRQSLTASPSCESFPRVSTPTLMLCPPTLPVTESPFSASEWKYGENKKRKLEYPGENGSSRKVWRGGWVAKLIPTKRMLHFRG